MNSETIDTYNKIADEYLQIHSDVNEVIYFVNFFLNNIKGKNILDVGCGPGIHADYFQKKGFNVTGIDLADSFLEIAKSTNKNINFLKMDMESLNFEKSNFDGLWVNGSFSHINKENAQKTLSNFNKILKNNGLLFLSVKLGEKEKTYIENKFKSKTKRFFANYSNDEISNLLKKSRFDIIKISNDNKWIDIFAKKF